MLSFIVSEALVDLRRAGRVGVSAILLITLSLTALGGFWLLSLNLGRAVSQWRDRVRVVVFLRQEPGPPVAAAVPRGSSGRARAAAAQSPPRLRGGHPGRGRDHAGGDTGADRAPQRLARGRRRPGRRRMGGRSRPMAAALRDHGA